MGGGGGDGRGVGVPIELDLHSNGYNGPGRREGLREREHASVKCNNGIIQQTKITTAV